MAVKIVRQPKKIALIGAPSSAAAFSAGSEKAPAALRAAGLADKLQTAGYEVVDYGDCAPRLFADDDEHRRARNLTEIVAGLNDLKIRVELAVKSGALVLVLGGDCAQVIGLLSGARRYYKHVNLLWFDRDADLNTPASTPSGRIDGMVVAHIIGNQYLTGLLPAYSLLLFETRQNELAQLPVTSGLPLVYLEQGSFVIIAACCALSAYVQFLRKEYQGKN